MPDYDLDSYISLPLPVNSLRRRNLADVLENRNHQCRFPANYRGWISHG